MVFSIQSYSVLNDTTAKAQHLGQKLFDLAIPGAVAVQLVPGHPHRKIQHDPTRGANFHIEVYCTMYSTTLLYPMSNLHSKNLKDLFIVYFPLSSKQSHRNWRAEPSAIRRSAEANSKRFAVESVPPGTS